MNAITRAYRGLVVSLKNAALRWSTGGGAWWGGVSGRSRIAYSTAVGDAATNTVVEACVSWLTTAFLEAPPRIRRYGPKDALTPEPRHPLLQLLRRPNPYFTGRELFQAILADQMLTGNSYVYKRRSAANRVVELWWLPSWSVEPVGEDGAFITRYEYAGGDGQKLDISPADIVHFPDRRDPRNPRKGLSKLGKLLREIYTDDEAATFTAAILSNLGIPGVIISPADDDSEITPDQADMMKADFRQKFGGDMRGEPLVLSGNVKVSTVSFSPEQMTLRSLRQVPEERISAVFGTPAVLVGLGAGLEHSIYNNYSEAREAAFEEKLIPIGKNLAERISLQLIPEFEGDPTKVEFDFDISDIRVLQEDNNALATRMVALTGGGLMLVDEARQEVGLEPLPDAKGQILYVPNGVTPTLPADLGAEPEPAPAPMPLLPAAPDNGGAAEEGAQEREAEGAPTELRRVAGAVLAEMKRIQVNGHGNGHGTPALIGE